MVHAGIIAIETTADGQRVKQTNSDNGRFPGDPTTALVTASSYTAYHRQPQDDGPRLESPGKIIYTIAAEECQGGAFVNITDTNATVHVMNLIDSSARMMSLAGSRGPLCNLLATVPEGLYMRMSIEDQKHFACSDLGISVFEFVDEQYDAFSDLRDCYYGQSNMIYPKVPTVLVQFSPYEYGPIGTPWLTFHFEATSTPGYQYIPVIMTSLTSGYVTSSDFRQTPYAYGMNASVRIWTPNSHVVMVSFPLADIGHYPSGRCPDENEKDVVKISSFSLGSIEYIPQKCEAKVMSAKVYPTLFQVEFLSDMTFTNLGFKILFSFHSDVSLHVLAAPKDGLFDCSSTEYARFKHHLQCNLEPECQGGEDERGCPFSYAACDGFVGYKDKCYTLVTWSYFLTWSEADIACRKRGSVLANLKTPGERQAVNKFFTYGKRRWLFYVGARRRSRQIEPKLMQYNGVWQWSDKTIAYDVNVTMHFNNDVYWNSRNVPDCTYLIPMDPDFLYMWHCDGHGLSLFVNSFICEFKNGYQLLANDIKFRQPTDPFPNSVTRCPQGHVTLDFLPCDKNPGADETLLFACDNQIESVHYSLLCDFWKDCQDGSDEQFCVRTECLDRTCSNGQCVTAADWCDGMLHCIDSSDERGCDESKSDLIQLRLQTRFPPPVLINLDGRGGISWTRLNESESCPETHFRCPGEYLYCMPVYVRCNGVYDCPGQEDEAGCDSFTCPGFYRCRASSICLHSKHMCDSVFQCPHQDDEWMCTRNRTCPEDCLCQGLAFVCTEPFIADAHPDLRYLDASGSGMMPDNLTSLFHLVNLRLAFCGLSTVTNMTFPNLLMLDLSDNKLTSVNIDIFHMLDNLRSLVIAGNPLVTMANTFRPSDLKHPNLRLVDLSRSEIHEFNSRIFSNFTMVATLNISHSALKIISVGFQHLRNLEALDLRGSPVKQYPSDIFTGLRYLRFIWTDNFKLCCRDALPKQFDDKGCVAPLDEISSCEDLLRSDVYRLCLWIFAALSVLGNAGCFFFRLLNARSVSRTGFNVFVTNLSVADFLMGVYLVIIGAADSVYRGKYLWYETLWKQNAACKLAGFLSLLSSEVSAFIICLITLDRFLVLRFPFSTLYFKRRSATVTSAVVWLLGGVLAAVPLLPSMAHWEFYSFQGRDYSFSVMITLNFVLFLLVAAGQLVVYWSVRSNVMTSETNRKAQDMTVARRLLSVAVSNFLCWFPIGFLGLLASQGTPIPGEVNVGMAIFVLPVNAALNPFLYTFNMLMEKRRKRQEKAMLSWFEACILAKTQERHNAASAADAPSADVDSVLQYIKARLDDRSLTYVEVLACLNFSSDEHEE